MFKSYVDSIIMCINNLSTYLYRSDEVIENRKKIYLDEAEKMFVLIIKVLTTYFPDEQSFSITLNPDTILEIVFSNDSNQWILYYSNIQDELTINEVANCCWDNNMNVSKILGSIFNKVHASLNQKLQNFKNLDSAYDNRLKVVREGNHALNSLLDTDLLDKLGLKQIYNSEIDTD